MKREKIIILPQLNDCKGDLNKKWFVFYSYRNSMSGRMVRFKIHKELHKVKTRKERYEAAGRIIQDLTAKLKAGWNPFNEDNAIYSDDLRYKFAARVYGRMKSGNKSFNFYSSEFVNNKLVGLEAETVSTYKSRLRIFDMWLDSKGMADLDITSVTNQVVINFFLFLITDKKLSENTTSKYKNLLYALFEFIAEKRNSTFNPVYAIPLNKRINDQTPRPINETDVEIFKNELVKDRQLWLAIQLEYYCFLRPGKEIRLLKIKWIDFARGLITIPKTIAKTKRDKVLIIPMEFLEVLRQEYQLHTVEKEYYVIGKNGDPGPEHIGKNNLRHRFVVIRKTLNMPEEYKLYSWKHTGNVRAAQANIPLYDRQQQNGHLSARTTEIYTKNKMGYESQAIRERFPKL